MTINIWLDDFRKPYNLENLLWFKDAESLIDWFKKNEPKDEMVLWLDHDLGMGATGYDFAKFFVEWNYDRGIGMKFYLLTSNVVGAFNIRQLLTHYGYEEVKNSSLQF